MEEYRANVAALLVNEEGLLLVCERLQHKGAWQFPQGGVDEGEEHDAALLREVQEEVGLWPEDYVVEESRGGYCYEFPPHVRASKPPHKARFVGQEQRYYLCRVKKGAREVNLMQEPREFGQAQWIEPEKFELSWVPEFKQTVYREVMRDFFGVELSE